MHAEQLARTVQSPFFGTSLNASATTAICGGSWSLTASRLRQHLQ